MEEKRDYDKELEKKDTLMWSDEDYKSMEKLTGFSEEDVQKENKKALQILLYSLAFIFILGIGILIGYNLPRLSKKEEKTQPPIEEVIKDDLIINDAYTKKNASGELYLYLEDNQSETYSIMDLSKFTSYQFSIYNNNLYLLIFDDNYKLYQINVNQNGYRTEYIKSFDIDEFSNVYLNDNIIYYSVSKTLEMYNIDNNETTKIEVNLAEILSIKNNKILYKNDNKVYLYDLITKNEEELGEDYLYATVVNDDKILYFVKNNKRNTILFYEYSNGQHEFISESTMENLQLLNYQGTYIYIDKNTAYVFENEQNKEIYKINEGISEIAFINKEEVIFIPSTYNITTCDNAKTKVGVYNLLFKQLKEQEIEGCLETQIINDLTLAKNIKN